MKLLLRKKLCVIGLATLQVVAQRSTSVFTVVTRNHVNRKSQEIAPLEDCESYFSSQRKVSRNEYTDYILKAIIMDIIQHSDDIASASSLQAKLLDSNGAFAEGYKTYIPAYTHLPSGVLTTFIKYACKYQVNDESVENFCASENRAISAMPLGAAIRLAAINDDDKLLGVVQKICQKISIDWEQARSSVAQFYQEKKSTEEGNTSGRPSSSGKEEAEKVEVAKEVAEVKETKVEVEVEVEKKETENYETDVAEESENKEIETKMSEKKKSTALSMQVPPFVLMLDVDAEFLGKDLPRTGSAELLDRTTTFLYDYFEETSTPDRHFKNLFLNMSIRQKQRRRLQSRSRLSALFEGLAYYDGGTPEADEVKEIIQEALSTQHFLKVLESSSDLILKSVERAKVSFQEDETLSPPAPKISIPSAFAGFVGGATLLFLGGAMFIYIYELKRQRRCRIDQEQDSMSAAQKQKRQPSVLDIKIWGRKIKRVKIPRISPIPNIVERKQKGGDEIEVNFTEAPRRSFQEQHEANRPTNSIVPSASSKSSRSGSNVVPGVPVSYAEQRNLNLFNSRKSPSEGRERWHQNALSKALYGRPNAPAVRRKTSVSAKLRDQRNHAANDIELSNSKRSNAVGVAPPLAPGDKDSGIPRSVLVPPKHTKPKQTVGYPTANFSTGVDMKSIEKLSRELVSNGVKTG